MKWYWSYADFPELASYSPRHKKIIWLNLAQWTKEADAKSWHRFIPALIIVTFIAGISIGAFYDSSPERGGLVGGLVGTVAVLLLVYFVGINSRRRLSRRYLVSEDFSLLPVNREVRVLLDPFRPHDDT